MSKVDEWLEAKQNARVAFDEFDRKMNRTSSDEMWLFFLLTEDPVNHKMGFAAEETLKRNMTKSAKAKLDIAYKELSAVDDERLIKLKALYVALEQALVSAEFSDEAGNPPDREIKQF